MQNSENIEKYILLDNLFNLFLDVKYQEEDDGLLKDEVINIDQIVQKNMLLFRQLRTQSKAELNQAKHDRVLLFLLNLRNGINSNIEKYKSLADEIFAKSKFAELQPMFRNLNVVSEEDKKSIILDSELLDFLSKIEEEYNTDNE